MSKLFLALVVILVGGLVATIFENYVGMTAVLRTANLQGMTSIDWALGVATGIVLDRVMRLSST